MSWVYGLVETNGEFDKEGYEATKEIMKGSKIKLDKNKFIHSELVLAEIYFGERTNKPYMFVPVDWKDIKATDKKMLFEDLIDQVFSKNKKHFWKEKDFK